MRNLLLVLLVLTMCGCTYHSQTDEPVTSVTYELPQYRSASSIGNLRRLALMPIELTSYKGQYNSEKDQLTAALSYEDACANFLTDKKGYEIVVLRDVDEKCRNGLLENVECICNQELHQKWKKTTAKKKTASAIQEIGRALNVDGILVIWYKGRKAEEDLEGWEKPAFAFLNVALLFTPFFYNEMSPDIGAWIYETATGQRVWSEAHSISASGFSPASERLVNLFTDLENAVPQQLIK